jgi:hypothetical protein
MKYSTGPLARKRFAIRLRRKLLRLLTHSAMELNPETAVGFGLGNIFPRGLEQVRIVRRGR